MFRLRVHKESKEQCSEYDGKKPKKHNVLVRVPKKANKNNEQDMGAKKVKQKQCAGCGPQQIQTNKCSGYGPPNKSQNTDVVPNKI